MHEKNIKLGNSNLSISTGKIAKQADASVIVNLDDTVVLVTVVSNKDKVEQRDFLPLTINYQEKAYAAGKIPGGYFKREGRPSEKETLTARLMDRPIRPLFTKGFSQDIQVMATVLSINPSVPADIPAIIGASAALSISGLPFNGPLAGVRVGRIDGMFVLNPSNLELQKSDLDLVVAGTKENVLMVESEASELSEEIMLSAVKYGHDMMQVVITAISEFKQELNINDSSYEPPTVDKELYDNISNEFSGKIHEAYSTKDKLSRYKLLDEIKAQAIDKFASEERLTEIVKKYLHDLEAKQVRNSILKDGVRIDGRDLKTVRKISVETGILPGAHGSCLFTRGETQAIVVSTLGSDKDKQMIDSIDDAEQYDYFMFHYNFPPYSVGQISNQLSPKRREIGHGKLARRSLEAVLPTYKEFPYVTRVVSEITESNGSSSMASVCGASLSMMDAGIPVKKPVSGIAMGLIKEGEEFAVLTDILGDEDHLGDMDFKVAGTKDGITALQMDIKIDGITTNIMEKALEQAKEGRIHILDIMNEHMNKPNELADNAPKIYSMKIPVNKIKDVIGKGGATIKSLVGNTDITIDIDDNGDLKLFSSDDVKAQEIIAKINTIIEDVEVGKVYEGKVMKIVDFGAFVSILNGKEGLLHISQIKNERVEKVSDVLSEGQIVNVKVTEFERGKFKLTMKELNN